jgi:hypothetical protein
MLVSVESPHLQGEFVLKLYDRRYATDLRETYKRPRWSKKVESRYHKAVREGHAMHIFDFCEARSRRCEYLLGDDSWNDVQDEAFLQYICIKSYKTESRAYDNLLDMQDKYIPRLFARGWLQPCLTSGVDKEFIGCPWILLEYIQGFALTDLGKYTPKTDWQSICEAAIHTIHMIGDRGICNVDVNTRSFVVSQEKGTGQRRVVMMDFGRCWFRAEAKNEEDFNEWQADMDEEGAIGYVMARKLKGGFVYRLSPRALNLLDRFKRESLDLAIISNANML